MVTTVAFRDGALWIGTQFRNKPAGADRWHIKIGRKTGKILGCVVSGNSLHILNVTGSNGSGSNVSDGGTLLAGAKPDIVWWFHAAR